MYTRNLSRRLGVVVRRLARVAVVGSPVREKAPVLGTEGTDMSTTTKKRMFAAASAVAFSSAGLLACPPVAQAIDCIQWGFPGDVLIQEFDTGWSVSFSATGTTANVPATARNSKTGEAPRHGTLWGKITSDGGVDMEIRTPQGNQRYQGKVGADGKASGTTTLVPYQGKHWVTQFPLSCVKQPDPVVVTPPPLPPQPPKQIGRDRDGDGMFNDDEINGHNTCGCVTDPDNPDSDGDGVNDGAEDDNGTDPNDRFSN